MELYKYKHQKYKTKMRQSEVKNTKINNLSDIDINKILEVSIKEEKFDLVRAEQLFLRTNQFNLSTRRLNRKQILNFEEEQNKVIKLFRVSDKFGDYGICVVYCGQFKENKLHITDLAISCRALGRGVEEFVFENIKELSKTKNIDEIKFNYIQTEKNKPIYDFFYKKGISINNFNFIS